MYKGQKKINIVKSDCDKDKLLKVLTRNTYRF